MSGVHFALETDNETCLVRDLGSTNGTQLNGTPLAGRALCTPAITIQAGETIFTVDIEGEAPRQTAAPAARPAAAAVEAAASRRWTAAAACPSGARSSSTVETCSSRIDALPRERRRPLLPPSWPCLLSQVVDGVFDRRFPEPGRPPPEELTQPDYLFDWLDPEVAAMVSPVVVSQADLLTWPELLAQGWGNDAVICLFSSREKPALLAHLREVVRVKGKRPDQGGAILGYCWPGVMSMLLAHNTPGFVSHLLAGIEAVLVEFADLPETWQLFGQPQIAELLNRFGFVTGESDQFHSKRRISHASGGTHRRFARLSDEQRSQAARGRTRGDGLCDGVHRRHAGRPGQRRDHLRRPARRRGHGVADGHDRRHARRPDRRQHGARRRDDGGMPASDDWIGPLARKGTAVYTFLG